MSLEQAQALVLGQSRAWPQTSLHPALRLGYLYQSHPAHLNTLPVLTGAIVYLTTLAFHAVPPARWLAELFSFIQDRSDDLEMCLRRIGHVEGWIDQAAALRHIARGQPAEAAQVAQVLYIVRQCPDSYAQAIALAHQSDAPDIVAPLVGGLSAARLGIAAIQPVLYANYEELLNIAQRLYDERLAIDTENAL